LSTNNSFIGRGNEIDSMGGRAVRLAGAAAALRERSGLSLGADFAAADRLAQLAALRESSGLSMSLGEREQGEHERQVESARRALDAAAASAAWAEGQAMTLGEAIAYALDQTS
jgi:hypothetical protein